MFEEKNEEKGLYLKCWLFSLKNVNKMADQQNIYIMAEKFFMVNNAEIFLCTKKKKI